MNCLGKFSYSRCAAVGLWRPASLPGSHPYKRRQLPAGFKTWCWRLEQADSAPFFTRWARFHCRKEWDHQNLDALSDTTTHALDLRTKSTFWDRGCWTRSIRFSKTPDGTVFIRRTFPLLHRHPAASTWGDTCNLARPESGWLCVTKDSN